MRRSAPYLTLLGFLVIVGAGAFILFGGRDSQVDIVGPDRLLPQAGGAFEAPGLIERSDGPGERVALAAPESEPDPDVMPESYRRALGIIRGRVVEADATPIPDLAVELYGMSALDLLHDAAAFLGDEPPQLEFRFKATTTRDDGTFVLEEMYPRALFGLGIDLGGPRATARFLDTVPGPGEVVDLGDIVLAPCAIISGRVEDESRAPVAGARVRATLLPPVVFLSGIQDYRDGCSLLVRGDEITRVFDPPPALKQFMHFLPVPTTTTADDGSFRLEGVELGLVSLVIDKVGFVTAKKSGIPTGRGGEREVGTIVIERGVTLKGKVADSLGEPVPDAEVRAGPMYGIAQMIVLQPPVRTGPAGEFSMPGANPLATFAAARRYPGDVWTVVGPFDPELEPPSIVLPPAYDLRVKVTAAPDGRPVAGARLKMREAQVMMNMLSLNPPAAPVERMHSPEPGIIDVRGLPAGKYELLVGAPGFGVTSENVTIAAGPAIKEVKLEPAAAAAVRVLTEKGKLPVEWAEVTATPDSEGWWDVGAQLARSRTDAAGLATLRNLGAGKYALNASHPGFAVAGGELEILPGEGAAEATILMKPGGTLAGIVHNAGSVDEGPYMIALTFEGGSGETGFESMTPRFTATDLEGRFQVANLNPGTWDVSVLKRVLDKDPLGLGEVMRGGPLLRSEAVIWTGETTHIELNLGAEEIGPCGTLTGTVFVDRRPGQGALVSIWAERRFEATVDSLGRFDLGEVPVGEHWLSVHNLPGITSEYDFRIRRSVNVEEGLPAEVAFEIFTGAIHGRVIFEGGGAPARGCGVEVRSEQPGEGEKPGEAIRMSTVSGLDGSFEVRGVPEGIYTVRARERGFACRAARNVRVVPGGAAGPVAVALVETVTVKGRLELAEGLAEGRWLALMVEPAGEETTATEWVQVDRKTGAFETTRLVPGSYRAQVLGNLDGTYGKMDFAVPPGGTTSLVLVPRKEDPQSDGEEE